MKHLTFVLVCCTIGMLHSQTFRYYKVGQKFEMNDNACLVIKKDLRLLLHSGSLANYKDVKAVKLVGFKDIEPDMDSLMACFGNLTQIKCLMFEDCDLNFITEPLASFTKLEDVRILKKNIFNENQLFSLLKNNPIKRISLQKANPQLNTDSLALLNNLETVQIASGDRFDFPNRTNQYQVQSQGNVRTIQIAYYGSFYKKESSAVKVPVRKITVKKDNPFVKQLDCVKPPLPGVNINDTAYSFSANQIASFYYQSGSRISIEPNSFLNADGSLYTGKVKLFYREFRTPVEIMLSGIPMTNKLDGQTQFFRSGGMYEVNATDSKGNQLTTKSESSLKISFALSDTSSSFGFYSLNNDGTWNTVSNKVTILSPDSKGPKMSKAVKMYLNEYRALWMQIADTTNYESRFASEDYCYTFRKDNMYVRHDSIYYLTERKFKLRLMEMFESRSKAFFRVKFVKETREKEIIYTFVPAKREIDLPDHIAHLIGKYFVYSGNLNKEEFKKTFSRKLLCWDFRPVSSGNETSLLIKTTNSTVSISGKLVFFKKDGSMAIRSKAGRILNNKIAYALNRDAKSFNRHERFKPAGHNDLNTFNNARERVAWQRSRKIQNETEKAMTFKEWLSYVAKMAPYMDQNSYMLNTEVGVALIESGLGIKNIDCYIHSGEMENILVDYSNAPKDSLLTSHSMMLYTSINTSFPLYLRYQGSLNGYYFKNRPNYLIRFSDNGYMQVTKPAELKEQRSDQGFQIEYAQGHYVKNMNSNEITRLIMN